MMTRSERARFEMAKTKINIIAPANPGAKPSVVATANGIAAARRAARDFSRGRRDLLGQDVRLVDGNGAFIEFAGVGA